MERHGTEIFDILKGKDFLTIEEIVKLAKASFGDDITFYTCGATNLSPEALLNFFIENNKFEHLDGKYRFGCDSECT